MKKLSLFQNAPAVWNSLAFFQIGDRWCVGSMSLLSAFFSSFKKTLFFHVFLRFFALGIKQNRYSMPYIQYEVCKMRALRILAAGVWYFVCTAVNNREPLFWSPVERARFMRVLNEARKRYVFELRGLRFCGPWVSFYIKPADGLELPEIMQ
jgi:hypothetical protein